MRERERERRINKITVDISFRIIFKEYNSKGIPYFGRKLKRIDNFVRSRYPGERLS